MTTRNLDKIFSPKSIILVGASEKPGSVGAMMTLNMLQSAFDGPIWFVNPKHRDVMGMTCYPDVESVPGTADLAVIAVPPAAVPGVIASLGKKGTRAAVILTAGVRSPALQQAMLDAAKPYCLRIIGPNCLGVLLPEKKVNAGFAHAMPQPGDIAFISQSGAIVSAVLDWSTGRNIGFSAMVSMGEMADVDVGDLLDYLAADSGTRSILMYLEQVTHARKFMSAARAAARVKPVIVIKAGRHAKAATAAKSHTGAMAGADDVYDAAFRRAGLVRVNTLEDLFDAAEMLGHGRRLHGERLAIVTNGGGAGILAVDALEEANGVLATLSAETLKKLNDVLPATWSGQNPVDIVGDATPERYQAAVEAVLRDPEVDALLVMNCPTALASGTGAATVTAAAARAAEGKMVLTSWLGDGAAQTARRIFRNEGIPTFDTPDDALRGFGYLRDYAKAQDALKCMPPELPQVSPANAAAAKAAVAAALAGGRDMLSEAESKEVLKAYGIPVVGTATARTPAEVRSAAEGFLREGAREVVIKILSPDISHKSDAGGVALSLPTAEAAEAAALAMTERVRKLHPSCRIEGFTVQPMIRRPDARELILGAADDATFGPVILFGEGGTAAELIGDRAIALPPLDIRLAHDLIGQTRVSKLMKPFRGKPAADTEAVALVLVRISQMLAEIPEIRELDINPLLADKDGVIALDARIVVRKAETAAKARNERFCIRPYPQQWEREKTLDDGSTLKLRPIRPEDESLYGPFIQKMAAEDMRQRFFASLRNLTREHIVLLTQIDYARAMAFVAIDQKTGELIGVSRLNADPDYERAEVTVMVRTDRQRRGLGRALLNMLLDYARSEGIGSLWGEIMYDNRPMTKLCRELGFEIRKSPQDVTLTLATLDLGARETGGADAELSRRTGA